MEILSRQPKYRETQWGIRGKVSPSPLPSYLSFSLGSYPPYSLRTPPPPPLTLTLESESVAATYDNLVTVSVLHGGQEEEIDPGQTSLFQLNLQERKSRESKKIMYRQYKAFDVTVSIFSYLYLKLKLPL